MSEVENTTLPTPSISPFQLQAASLLAQGYLIKQVAEILEVPPETIIYWRRSTDFKELTKQIAREMEEEIKDYTTRKMNRLQAKAIDTLENLLGAASESVQLGAVKEVFEHGPMRVQKGIDTRTLPSGTIILQERMLLAMNHASQITGDAEMQAALASYIDAEAQEVPSEGVSEEETGQIEDVT